MHTCLAWFVVHRQLCSHDISSLHKSSCTEGHFRDSIAPTGACSTVFRARKQCSHDCHAADRLPRHIASCRVMI